MLPPVKDLNEDGLTISFKPSKRKKVNKVFITLKGDLVLNSVHKIRERLSPALAHYDFLSISLNDVRNIDVSGIQLLHYLSNSGKDVTIDSNLSDKFRSLISISGFSDFLHKPKLT